MTRDSLHAGMSSHAATPKVSVLLPVRNGERWLKASLDSIMEQTFQDFEILLIDDASTDDTRAIAESFKSPNLRILDGPGTGLANALKIGVAESRGQYIARQDADDLSAATRLAKQYRFLESHPHYAAVGSQAIRINEEGARIGKIALPSNARAIAFFSTFYNPLVHSSVMVRHTALLRAGNYWAPSSSAYPEDFDLWSRLSTFGAIGNIESFLIAYRDTSTGISSLHAQELASAAASIAEDNIKKIVGRSLTTKEQSGLRRLYSASVKTSPSGQVSFCLLLIRVRCSVGLVPAPRSGFVRILVKSLVHIFTTKRIPTEI